jgi:protein tyrosine phosphatase (PTP) superfamily phosphohydrolase (DUF442 family)
MSDEFKPVSVSRSIAGQVTPEQLQQAAQQGFKSISFEKIYLRPESK